MLATVLSAAMVASTPAVEPTKFAHTFVKDESTALVANVIGDLGGSELKIDFEFNLKTNELTDGGAKVAIEFTKTSATMDGNDLPSDDETSLNVELNKFGAPKELVMEGFRTVAYIALLTRYLPGTSLDIAQTYTINEKSDSFTYTAKGTYTEDRAIEGKTYAVLTSKGEFAPGDQEEGTIDVTVLVDKATGKIFTTDAVLGTPDGEIKMSVKSKA